MSVLTTGAGAYDPAHEVAAPNGPPRPIQADAVEALVDNVRSLMVDEAQRASSLMTRGSGLTGFAGIILALTGTASHSGHGLTGPLRNAVAALSAAALVSLALAVVIVVIGVLVPRAGVTIAIADIRRYPTNAVVRQDRVIVQGTILRGLVHSLERERARNGLRAAALRFGFVFLCVGLALVTAVGVTLAVSGHFYG